MTALSGATVLVTGATGFIGAHCLDRLLSTSADIHAVNRVGQGPYSDNVTWHAADLRDAVKARAIVNEVRPSHVLHTAWNVTHGEFWTAPDNLDWLEGGIGLLRGLVDVGPRRFVGVGTCAEYDWTGDSVMCVEDETPIRPATLYGKAKAALWSAAQAYAEQGGFSAAWGRLFLPYGRGDNEKRLIPSLLRAVRRGERFTLRAAALERDFVFAPDAADLLVTLLANDAEGSFNIGSGEPTRLGDAAGYLARALGQPDLLDCPPAGDRGSEPLRLVADMGKVRDSLGWTAPTSLHQGLDHLLRAV